MEKNKVPQDDENIFEGHSKMVYALDENGNYVKVPTRGWEPENVALQQAWETIHERTEVARRMVLEGRMSPLGFFMEKNMMNTKLLSEYTGISERKIKKHLEPKVFSSLTSEVISEYASVFKISPEQLTNIASLEREL